MARRVAWNIAAPMMGLGAFLLGLGIFAAWNVHEQQKTSSELILREVHGILSIDELNIAMRETRYQLNLFLRTRDLQHLEAVSALHDQTNALLQRAKQLARTEREQQVIGVMEVGYLEFFENLQTITTPIFVAAKDNPPTDLTSSTKIPLTDEQYAVLTKLADDLTTKVLQPLKECLAVNQQVVELTHTASQETARHLKVGFLLLGICGASAGTLLGTAVARAVSRSIIQLDISVRDAAGRLSDVGEPVTFASVGDLAGLETSLRKVQQNVAEVVERLQKRESELLRSEQLAQVGQLAAGLAHEIRNPLMPMKTLVQAAIARGDEAGLKGRSLHIINDEISRMEKSIQAFLDFARPPVPEKTAVAIDDVVQSTLELVMTKARQQGVVILTRPSADRIIAKIDQSQIRQLLLNIVLNAIDALPNGGMIQVTVETHRTYASTELSQDVSRTTEHDALRLVSAPVALKEPRPGEWLVVKIADNGEGIPDAMLDSVFEPFVSTKETGSGLGLSICQHIAAAHSGRLSVRNRPEGGAEFLLFLPCAT